MTLKPLLASALIALFLAPAPIQAQSNQPQGQIYRLEPGGTLDGLLAEAGLDPVSRTRLTHGLAEEYDLSQLRPGVELAVKQDKNGMANSFALKIDARIRFVFDAGNPDSVIREELPTQMSALAEELAIEGSVYAAFQRAGVPAQFAIDLAQAFGATVDFRRDLRGGETLRVMWQQETGDDGIPVRAPVLTYAALLLGGTLYEAAWSSEESPRQLLFRDGEALKTFTPPVAAARISSQFGIRRHPVLGGMRMHKGVDFAAARGTEIRATASGKVSFSGRRKGYGRVVEVRHGSTLMTRYAHLDRVAEGIRNGVSVDTDSVLGTVGSTGLSSGPNLHFEVRVDGRPVDPLSDERLAGMQTVSHVKGASILETRRIQFAFLNSPAS